MELALYMAPILTVAARSGVFEEMPHREGQEAQAYAGQAFCDDGLFLAENKHELQVLCDKVSAFCELYQVKVNAGKSYYTVDRGSRRHLPFPEALV